MRMWFLLHPCPISFVFHIFSLCALTDQIITDMRSWCINNMVSLSELNLLCTAAKWEAFRSVQIFPSSCPRRFGRLHRWKTKFEFESIWSFTYPGEHSPSTAVQARFEDFVNFSTGDKKIDLESISSFIPPGAHDQSWSDYDNFEDFVNCSAGDKTQNLKAFYLLSIQENIVNLTVFIFYPFRRTWSILIYQRRCWRLSQLFHRW